MTVAVALCHRVGLVNVTNVTRESVLSRLLVPSAAHDMSRRAIQIGVVLPGRDLRSSRRYRPATTGLRLRLLDHIRPITVVREDLSVGLHDDHIILDETLTVIPT